MALSIGILFGIIAMLSWGITDFFAAKSVRKSSVFKTYFWIQAVALAIYSAIFLLFFDMPPVSLIILGVAIIASFLGISSVLSYYKGLQVGYVSIICPIAASYAIITVILSIVFLDETLSSLRLTAISLVIFGGILASFKFHDLVKLRVKNIAKGANYAIFAMIGWGIMFVLLDFLISELGWFMPVFLIVAAEIIFLLAYSGTAGKSISFPKNVAFFVVLAGILEATAFLATGKGISFENASIVAPIISAFPAVTIILARIFFKEILEINQKVGVVSVLIGLILLSI